MRTWTGVLFVVISAAGFSTLGILGRYAYADGLDPLTILFLRFTMSTAIMAAAEGPVRLRAAISCSPYGPRLEAKLLDDVAGARVDEKDRRYRAGQTPA